MSRSSSVMALRQSFGDRKPPDITRKITACVACRKLKIKCHMVDAKPPCSRCRNRKLSCTVNKSIQMLLESDIDWKDLTENRLGQLEAHLGIRQALNTNVAKSADHMQRNSDVGSISQSDGTILDLSCRLGAFPSSSLVSHSLNDQDVPRSIDADIVTRGLTTKYDFEKHFSYYQYCLNPHIHYLISSTDTAITLLHRSSLLSLAICAVAALCAGTDDYQTCLKTFIDEVSTLAFYHVPSFDDVRALCIGAFWLGKEATALNAMAVCFAGQLNLHRCLTKMPHTTRTCYDRTRLYFIMYICDHQMSLSHGRPPMTGEFRSLKKPRTLLDSTFSTSPDLRLVSEVELWSINAQVFEKFGAATDSAFVPAQLHNLQTLNDTYEHWHQDWTSLLRSQLAVNPISSAVLDLIFHSAILNLHSHVFRGRGPQSVGLEDAAGSPSYFAFSAVQNASAIINRMAELNEAQATSKISFYFCTILAFASVFLLKVPRRYLRHGAQSHSAESILQALERLVFSASSIQNSVHPAPKIIKSLEAALKALSVNEDNNYRYDEEPGNLPAPSHHHTTHENSNSEVQGSEIYDFSLGLPGLEDFDFLCTDLDFSC